MKAYKKLSIQNGQQTTYLSNGVPQSTLLNFVLLGNGTRVEDPRDLAPAVEADSATGRFIAKYDAEMASAKKPSTILMVTSAALLAVGLAVGTPLYASRSCAYCYIPNETLGLVVLTTGVSLGMIAFVSWTIVGQLAAYGNQQDRVSAFMTYNQSLRERLALDDESLDNEQDKRARPLSPSATLIPAASQWLVQLTR